MTVSPERAVQWNVATGQPIQQVDLGDATNFAISPKADFVLTSDEYVEAAILWSLDTGEPIRRFGSFEGMLTFVGFSPGGRFMLTQTPDEVGLWKTDSGKFLHGFETSGIERGMLLPEMFCGEVTPVVSPDGKTLVFQDVERTTSWNMDSGKQLARLTEPSMRIDQVAYANDGSFALTKDDVVWVWNAGGDRPRRISPAERINASALSRDGRFLLTGHDDPIEQFESETAGETQDGYREYSALASLGDDEGMARLWDIEKAESVAVFTGHEDHVDAVAFSPDGKLAATCAENVRIWDVSSSREVKRLDVRASQISFSPDGRQVLTTGKRSGVRLWNVNTGEQIRLLEEFERGNAAFFPDSRTLITSRPATVLWNARDGRPLRYVAHDPASGPKASFCLAVSPDSRTVFTVGFEDTNPWSSRFWDIASSEAVGRLATDSLIRSAVFSPDGETLLTTNMDGAAQMWSTSTGEEICRLHAFGEDGWSVVTPDGRFDSNDLDRVDHHHWVMPDDPLQPLPIEVFMRDYYEPKLLAKVLAGRALPPIRDLTSLNRVQPRVEIARVNPSADRNDRVDVTVNVFNVTRTYGGTGHKSGMRDLHLFRDGRLVDYHSLRAAPDSAAVTFPNVRLPRSGAGRVEFTAYAFNSDRVKSETTRPFVYPVNLPARKGRVYVVSVGVDAFEPHHPQRFGRLRFAVSDATAFAELLTKSFRGSEQFDAVVPITLTSPNSSTGLTPNARQAPATKRNIKAVFDLLAGHKVGEQIRRAIPNADRIGPASPEDTIIISFSTHGYTRGGGEREAALVGQVGEFYLVPMDIGDRQGGKVLDRCISADQLSTWLRKVDAGEIVMIIDACQSAGSTGQDFKPGPMGNRGLGQLAYNKRMRILAASQITQPAKEVGGEVGHGLLSYALLKEGLEQSGADHSPKDNKITIGEWLKFGEQQVPILAGKVQRGELRIAARGITSLDEQNAPQVQQPALFDFTKDRDDVVLKEIQARTARKNR